MVIWINLRRGRILIKYIFMSIKCSHDKYYKNTKIFWAMLHTTISQQYWVDKFLLVLIWIYYLLYFIIYHLQFDILALLWSCYENVVYVALLKYFITKRSTTWQLIKLSTYTFSHMTFLMSHMTYLMICSHLVTNHYVATHKTIFICF